MEHTAKERPTKGKSACRGEGKEHTDDDQQQGPMTLGELAKKIVVENTAFTWTENISRSQQELPRQSNCVDWDQQWRGSRCK